MKKKLLLFIVSIITFIGYSQVPAYYNDVNLNLSGQLLKDELANKVINTHTTFLSYTPGVWDALKQTDLDPTDPTKVLLIYGWDDTDGDITNDRTRGVNDNGGGTGVWNREHVYPKSLANPDLGTEGAGADAHNLRPCDSQRNSSRSNRKFAAGNGNSGTTPQGHWYPGDEWKGDVARMMMYMYLRYGSRTLPINVGIGNPVSGDPDMIDLFLQWNAEDPVSDLEKQRNPVLEGLQGNRNPFIDNPAFATQIWGGPQAEDLFGNTGGNDTEVPSIPTGLVATNTTITTTQLSWNASSDNIGVTAYEIHQNGMFLITVTSTNYTVSGLSPNTTYSFSVKAKDAAGNLSAASTALSVTTPDTSSGGNATELFFSEYIEGSSNNKALEIANFTGASVNLTGYSIKKQTNGAGSWSGGLNLTGTIINGEVFVIANSSATTTILNEADVTTGSSEVTFNGNDAVGLFKNDVLIDIIGTFNGGTANFAQNVTLQRNPSVIMPTVTYDPAEWSVLAQDTFTDLGIHTFDGGGTSDSEAPSIPTNVIASNITDNSADLSWTASTDNIAVTGYDIYQNGNLLISVSATNYSVTGLAPETSYSYTVAAKDAAGNISAQSNLTNVTTLPISDTTAPTAPTNLVTSNITESTVDLSWTAATDNVGVTEYEIYQNGILTATTSTTNYAASGLSPNTTYAYYVIALDATGNMSSASTTVNATTLDVSTGGNASDLFFSEYIEGSSFNKALEIANFTSNAVDLSVYTIKKQTNGAGSWSSGLNLTGSLANGDVYIVANSSAASAILNEADIATGSSEVTFNGNDAVGLFKNDILIDIIGTFNGGTANFAQNVTLIRKADISSPSPTYNTAEWNSFASDTFADLGIHTFNGGTPDTEAPSAPTNLVASNVTESSTDISWTASTDNVAVTEYDVYQNGTLLGSTTNTSYNVSGLNAETTYAFTISAKDAAGNISAISTTLNVTTTAAPDTIAPSVPTDLIAVNITEITVDLTWTASTDNVGVTGYDIYQDGVFVATVTTTSYTISGLTAGTSYIFEVNAFDAANNISSPANVTVTTSGSSAGSITTLHEGFFETGFDGWIDGGSDCDRYSGSRSFEGSYSIRLRDNSGVASSMTLEGIDVSTYDTVEVDFVFYPYSMENNEDFWLRYHDGSSWTTVATFTRGVDFENQNFYAVTITLDPANYNFVNNAKFRFQADASGNNDQIYIDQVSIKGIIGNPARASIANKREISLIRSMIDNQPVSEEDFIIISNPVVGNNLQVAYYGDTVPTFRIINLLGQVMKTGKLDQDDIEVSALTSGIYVLELNDGEESMSKKFVKN